MRLVSEIAEAFKQRLESITLVPSAGGRFEIELDGDLVYSKLETGSFPEASKIKKLVSDRL